MSGHRIVPLQEPVQFGRIYCNMCNEKHRFVAYRESHTDPKFATCSGCGWVPGENVDRITDPTTGRVKVVRSPAIAESVLKKAKAELATEIEDYLVRLGLPRREAKIHAGTAEPTIR